LASHENHGSRAIFRAEVRGMERMDIPYFQLDTGSRDLLDEEATLSKEFLSGRLGMKRCASE
jgi:lantibiotic modifying enzyme